MCILYQVHTQAITLLFLFHTLTTNNRLLMIHFAQLAPKNASKKIVKLEMTSGYSQVPENVPKVILKTVKCKTFLREHTPAPSKCRMLTHMIQYTNHLPPSLL